MSEYFFSKSDRILKRSEFLNISKEGKRLHNKYFFALYMPGQTDKTRLGITVTKKIGKAIIRNRIKRLTREYFRLNRHNIKGTWDINIIAGRQTAQTTSEIIFLSLEKIFKYFFHEHTF